MDESIQVEWAVKNTYKEKKYQCKNKMLQCINELKNLSVNWSKESEWNDIISFEKHFNEWDDDLIILSKINYWDDKKWDYVYIQPVWIYDNIWIFARMLQSILPHEDQINVIEIWSKLHIYTKEFELIAYTWKLNQAYERSHKDWYKYHIVR